MNTEETRREKEEGKCCDFGEAFKGFREMCGKMGMCCPWNKGSNDFAEVMKKRMKNRMRDCCASTDRNP